MSAASTTQPQTHPQSHRDYAQPSACQTYGLRDVHVVGSYFAHHGPISRPQKSSRTADLPWARNCGVVFGGVKRRRLAVYVCGMAGRISKRFFTPEVWRPRRIIYGHALSFPTAGNATQWATTEIELIHQRGQLYMATLTSTAAVPATSRRAGGICKKYRRADPGLRDSRATAVWFFFFTGKGNWTASRPHLTASDGIPAKRG